MGSSVRVESIKWHTYDGVPREAGAAYDAGADYVETLIALGMAKRIDETPIDETPIAAPDSPTAVTPISTDDVPTRRGPGRPRKS